MFTESKNILTDCSWLYSARLIRQYRNKIQVGFQRARLCENSVILKVSEIALQFSFKIALKWTFQHYLKSILSLKDSHIYHHLCQSAFSPSLGRQATTEHTTQSSYFIVSMNECGLTAKSRQSVSYLLTCK